MDGQSFDPKFGTEILPQKTVKPITNRDEFVSKLIQNRNEVKPERWFKVENLFEEGEDIAEQTGASEFAAGIQRPDYDPALVRSVGDGPKKTIDLIPEGPAFTGKFYNPTQDNKWLYGENLGVTRYESLRRAVGLEEGQSFTEFYNVNKFIPAGFELDAKLLLREEKIKKLENDMLEGRIGYDTFLYRAYGKDILKSQGHDLDSSLYWYSQRKRGNFSNIKNNLYYMNEIIRSAEQTYISEAWNRTASTLKLSDLDAYVASEKPLSTVQMKQIFPELFDQLSETIDSDRKIQDLFLSGQLGKIFQPFLDTDGDGKYDYYMHLNGRLYSAAESSVASNTQAKVTYDDKGKVASVFLPGVGDFDGGALDTFAANFSKVFTGVVEFGWYLVAGAMDAGDFLLGNVAGLWEESAQEFGEATYLSSAYTGYNKWVNSMGLTSDDFWIADQSLFQNGDINVANAARGVAAAAGTVLGMASLAWVGGILGKGGALLSNVTKGTALNVGVAGSYGYKVSQIGGFIPKAIYGAGSLLSRLSMIKNGAPILARGLWGMSAEAAGYLAFRDFLSTTAELSARNEVTQDMQPEDIMARATEMSLINGVITFGFRTVADSGLTDKFATLFKRKQILASSLKKSIENGTAQAWSSYATKFTRLTGTINTLSDVFENWATMAITMGVSMNEEDYTPLESFGNFFAGSKAMLTSPNALAMQIFQAGQTYFGSALAFKKGYGQETRNIEQALSLVQGTREEVSIELTNKIAQASGPLRETLLGIRTQYENRRRFEYTYVLNKDGSIESSDVQRDANGKEVNALDPISNEVSALLWLKDTLEDTIDPKSNPVAKALIKTIDSKKIEDVVIRHQIAFGVYNDFMSRRREKYEDLLKNPKAVYDLFNKGYNIYKKMEVALGRSKTPEGALNKARMIESMKRNSLIDLRLSIAAEEIKLLEKNPKYKEAWENVSGLIVIENSKGRIDFSKLTVDNLRTIAAERAKAAGDTTVDLKGKRGYLVRYIVTNLKPAQVDELVDNYKTDSENLTKKADGFIITVKGAGTGQEKQRAEIIKLLDVLASWEMNFAKESGNSNGSARIIKLEKGEAYIISGIKENEFQNLSLIDYIGTFMRLATSLKLSAFTSEDVKFKNDAFNLLIDTLDGQKAGTFAKDIADPAKKDEAARRANQLVDTLVSSNVLTYEQAALILRDEFMTDEALKSDTSVAYFKNSVLIFSKVVDAYNLNKEAPGKDFTDNLAKFVSILDVTKSPKIRQAILDAVRITEADLNKLKDKGLEAMANIKKTLGSLVGLRLPANLDLNENSGGNISAADAQQRKLSFADMLSRTLKYLNELRFRRVVGIEGDFFGQFTSIFTDIINAKANGLTLILSTKKGRDQKELDRIQNRIVSALLGKQGNVIEGIRLIESLLGNDQGLNNFLISVGLTSDELNNTKTFFKDVITEIVKESYAAFRKEEIQRLSPEEWNKRFANRTEAEVKAILFDEYIDAEYKLAASNNPRIVLIEDTDPLKTSKKIDWLLNNDRNFLRNAGDRTPFAQEKINNLENQVKEYFQFVIEDTLDVPSSGKVVVNLNAFFPPGILSIYRRLDDLRKQNQNIEIPVITKLEAKQIKDVLSSLGITSNEQQERILQEYEALLSNLKKYPDGIIVFDLLSQSDKRRFISFLKEFRIEYSQQKNKLRDFGIYGKPLVTNGVDDVANTSKVIELIFKNNKEGLNYNDLIARIQTLEREYFEKNKAKIFSGLTESVESRLNAIFSNTIFIDNDTLITNTDNLSLSTLDLIGENEQVQLVRTLGALAQAEVVKYGKAGGLAQAINLAFEQLGIGGKRNENFFKFKLLFTLSKFLVDYSKSSTKQPIFMKFENQTKDDWKMFEATGIWNVRPTNQANIYELTIKEIKSESEAFEMLVKWITNSTNKGQNINFKLLLPATDELGGLSVVTSPTTATGQVVAGQGQRAGTGDNPISVLRRNLQQGVRISDIFDNLVSFDLTNFELTVNSIKELSGLKGLSIKDAIEKFKDSKNPYIRMALATLQNGLFFSKYYQGASKKAIIDSKGNLSDDAIKTLMNPKARRIIGKILEENLNASIQDLTLKINVEISNNPSFLFDSQSSLNALQQYKINPDEDFVNQSMLGTFRPDVRNIKGFKFAETDIEYLKNRLDNDYYVSSEENYAIYNPYSAIKALLISSNIDNDPRVLEGQKLNRISGGPAMRIDVEGLFGLSEEELQALNAVINQSNYFVNTGVFVKKFEYLSKLRRSSVVSQASVIKLSRQGAPSTEQGSRLFVKTENVDTSTDPIMPKKIEEVPSSDSRVSAFIENLDRRSQIVTGRNERVKLNDVLNNNKFNDVDQNWALVIEDQLTKFGENASVGNRAILNLSKNENVARYAFGIASAAEVIERLVINNQNGFSGNSEEKKNVAIKIATSMQILSDGTDFVSMATRYLFVDLTTGEVINTASLIDGPSNPKHLNDFYNKFFQVNKPGSNFAIIELNKNMFTGAGSLSKEKFGYYIVNDSNRNEYTNIILRNIAYQANEIDDLKNKEEMFDKVTGVLSATVTTRDFERSLLNTFMNFKEKYNLETNSFNYAAQVLIGTLSDTIYHSNGTYTTQEMFEARELGYEVESDEEFELRVSARDKKIVDIVTYFVNMDSLPFEVKSFFADLKLLSSNYFDVKNRVGEIENKDTLRNINFAILQNQGDLNYTRKQIKESRKRKQQLLGEKYKILSNIFENFRKKKEEINSLSGEIKDARIKEDAETENYFKNPREVVVKELKKIQASQSSAFKKILNESKELFKLLEDKTVNPFYVMDIIRRKIIPALDDINMEEANLGLNWRERPAGKLIKVLRKFSKDFEIDFESQEYFDKFSFSLKNEIVDLKKKRDELYKEKKQIYLEIKQNTTDNPIINKVLEEEKNLNKLIKAKETAIINITYLYDSSLSAALLEKRVNDFYSNNSDYIKDVIEGKMTSEEFASIARAEAKIIEKEGGGYNGGISFLEGIFDEYAVRLLLEGERGESINYRLIKLAYIKANKKENVIQLILDKHNSDPLKKNYLDRFLVSPNANVNERNVMIDIEGFYDNNLNKKRTAPFLASIIVTKKITDTNMSTFLSRVESGEAKLSWDNFKTYMKQELVEEVRNIFIPVYVFNPIKNKYELVTTDQQITSAFPDFNKEYLTQGGRNFSGGIVSVRDQYLNFVKEEIKNGNLKTELSEQEHKALMNDYVGKKIKDLESKYTLSFYGYNNKAYDEKKLLDTDGDVGYSLISNKNIFNQSFDVFTELMRGLPGVGKAGNNQLSLTALRRREGIDGTGAHDSEDDGIFTLYLMLKEMNNIEDSDQSQSSIINKLNKFKNSLGLSLVVRGFNKGDASRIENKINDVFDKGNVNSQSISSRLSPQEAAYFNDYLKVMKASNDERSKLSKEIAQKREDLFKQNAFKKNWAVYDEYRDRIDEDTRIFAESISNEKTRTSLGIAMDYVVKKLFFHFNPQASKDSKMSEMLNFKVPNKNITIVDLVSLAIAQKSRAELTGSNVEKFRKTLIEGSKDSLTFVKSLIRILNDQEGSKNFLSVDSVDNEFKDYSKNQIQISEFNNHYDNDSINDFKTNSERAREESSFINSIKPIVSLMFEGIEDSNIKRMFLEDIAAMVAYNFNQPEIKSRLNNFGFNKTLSNVNREKLLSVLDGMAASKVGYKSMYKLAQFLSTLGPKVKVFDKSSNKFIDEDVSNDTYYISESEFKTLFNIKGSTSLEVAVSSVRERYNLKDTQELYISILRQPSDKQNTLHNYKLRVMPNNSGLASAITIDALKSNHSGDVDGDKLFIFLPTASQLFIANKIATYQHGALQAIGKAIGLIKPETRVIPNKKDVAEKFAVFLDIGEMLVDKLMTDYNNILFTKDGELRNETDQKNTYDMIRTQTFSMLKEKFPLIEDAVIEEALDFSWLKIHDVRNSVIDKPYLFTTQNQSVNYKEKGFFVLQENIFQLQKYIFKSKLGNLDSVTGLYQYPKSNQLVTVKDETSGFGRLFQTTGVHLTKDTLDFIKANSLSVINNLISIVQNDQRLEGTLVSELFDPTRKDGVSAKEFLINSLNNLKSNEVVNRSDIAVLIQAFLDTYDIALRNNKDYNNFLFTASKTKNFILNSEDYKKVSAKEREQEQALRDIAFSMGFDIEKDINGSFINSFPELLDTIIDSKILDNTIKFSNAGSFLASRILLAASLNAAKKDSMLIRDTIGDNKEDWNNFQRTKILYTVKSSFAGNPMNNDFMYSVGSNKNLRILNMNLVNFSDTDSFEGLNRLGEFRPGQVIRIKEPNGLEIRKGEFIPYGSEIVVFDINRKDKYVLFAYVNSLNDPETQKYYKVVVPGTNQNKNTLGILNTQAINKNEESILSNTQAEFVKQIDEKFLKELSQDASAGYTFYDESGNVIVDVVANRNKIAYVLEDTKLSVIEDTKEWGSNRPKERFFDDPSIINNAGNPEALMWFGRLGKMMKVQFNNDGTITAELDNRELNEIQTNLKKLNIHDVDENNGLRLLRLMQAKTIIYNSPVLKDQTSRDNLFSQWFNKTNLNLIEAENELGHLYQSLYPEEMQKAAFKNTISKNKMLSVVFSKQLRDQIFEITPSSITALSNNIFNPTKSTPVEQALAKMYIQAKGSFVELQSDVVNKDTVTSVGEDVYVDGLGHIGQLDLLNQLLSSVGVEPISKTTINKISPVIGARNRMPSSFASKFKTVLWSDAFKGNPNPQYAGENSPKTGLEVTPNYTQLNVSSEAAPLITVPKAKADNMFSKDHYSIDESFLKKMVEFYGSEKVKTSAVYNDEYYKDVFKFLLVSALSNSKNVNEKIAQIAAPFKNYALIFDTETIYQEDGKVRVGIKRAKLNGKISDLEGDLKKQLGSVSYWDIRREKEEVLNNNVTLFNSLKEAKMTSIDALDLIEKGKQKPDLLSNFKSLLENRKVYMANKALAVEKFKKEYEALYNNKTTNDFFRTNFELNAFDLAIKNSLEPERPIHTLAVDKSKKNVVLINKNLDDEDVINLDPMKLTSSGISEEDPRSFEVSQIVTLLKKEPSQVRGYLMGKINSIKDLAFKYGLNDEINLYMYNLGMGQKLLTLESALAKETDDGRKISLEDQIEKIKKQFNVNSAQELLNKNKEFETVYGFIASELQETVTVIYNYQNSVTRDSNEPIQDIYWIILPTVKKGTNKMTFENVKSLVFNPQERMLSDNGHATYEGYNFFRSIESTVYSLSKHIAAENFSARAMRAKVLVNLPVVNFVQQKMYEFLKLESTQKIIKEYDGKNSEYRVFDTFKQGILDILHEPHNIFLADKDTDGKNAAELYLQLIQNIDTSLSKNGMTYHEAQATMKREQPRTLIYNKAQDIANLHEFRNDALARLNGLIGKDTLSEYLFNELQTFAQSKGYALADKYGRKRTGKIEDIRPLSEVSLEWVGTAVNDNVAQLGGYRKNLITSALNGDIYFIDSKLQEHLHKYFFVTKAPSKFLRITRKIQSLATALIMSNPFKIADRITKYSLTDLTFMSLANPKTILKLNESRKDLSAFFQSKSAVSSAKIEAFLKTQGIDPSKANFDVVLNDFEEVQSKGTFAKQYFNYLGRPFEFQTLLVRYAYWLQTVEDLNNGKTNVYGSSYYNKENVDSIKDTFMEATGELKNTANENKAAYLVSQQLGAPGDFPLLAKDLNGLFMFTTFPLALVRWAKGEAFSMQAAVKNLFVDGERKSALAWLATQGGGLLGSALLVQTIISLIASLYNVDDETTQQWQEQQALPDVLATILNGSPVFDVYNTADPIKLLSDLTYAPFVEAAQERKEDAIYGKPDDGNLIRGNGVMKWVFQNILGKVNPAFKDPIETVLGISSLGDSVYLQDGPGYENFIRKMSTYIFGSSGSRALNKYIGTLSPSDPITANTFFTGLSKVISAELGNTKAYKGDVKNYYKVLSKIKTFNYLQNQSSNYTSTNNTFDADRYSTLRDDLRQLLRDESDFGKIYSKIVLHLENGGSLQEVRSALNNLTILGSISKIDDLSKLTDTLSEKEIYDLEKAIVYEESMFPWLNDIRQNIQQSIEESYSRGSRYVPRYYQPYIQMYGDSRNIYYRPPYSKFNQNPFNAYRSMWYTVNQIGMKKNNG